MKKVILSIAASLFVTAGLFAQAKFADVAKLEQEVIDQGKIKQGSPEPARFIIKNISSAPIIIEQAQPTCGCTISDYTKTPIAPGQTGYIAATYNALNAGHFTKVLNIKLANVDEMKGITLQGDVLAADEYDKWRAENPAKPAIVETPAVKPSVASKTAKTTKTTKTTKTVKTTKTPVTVKKTTTAKA